MSGGKIVPNSMVSVSTALQNPEFMNAVTLIASDIASCQFKNYPPTITVLNNPSTMISSYNFWQSAYAQLLLTGNSYLLVARDKNNLPASLEQIPTSQVELNLADDGKSISYQINFDDDRPNIEVASTEMIHLRLLCTGEGDNTLAKFIGISPLESLANTLRVSQNSDRLTLKQLEKAILPSNVITLPVKTNKEGKDKVRREFEAQYTGDNAGSTLVLDNSATLSQLQINADVAKFLNTIDADAGRIATAFGIPASYLSPNKSDNQSNVSQIQSLYVNSLTRYIDPIVSELKMKLQLPNLELDINKAIDRDGNQLINNIQKLTSGTAPVLTQAQAVNLLESRDVFTNNELNGQG
ncbi:phage portal protein [Lactobacillus sp. ESL0791]|uniref:phage portal protein n=1 Tax=Lactobacillus sp. ESL0791 TaxID=2983234 RepID=UPI0023F71C76|nr:phage portal protein [Lactobacillus sp. ESL0791]MDF7639956.1 phage portal protein [Lactobacillus sp. ESL0791]